MIGSKIVIKSTNQVGKVIGQAKGLWIIELFNGNTAALPTKKLKLI